MIVDEVYIKSSVTYSGGVLFGYSEDAPKQLANTLLCVIIKGSFHLLNFLAKLVTIHALTVEFQFNTVKNLISLLEECVDSVISIIKDNNRINEFSLKCFLTSL